MTAILNQYSYVVFSLFVGITLAAALWRWRRVPAALRVLLVLLYVVGAVVFGTSRRYPDPQVTSVSEAEAILQSDQPTLVMLYSNY